MGGSGIVGELLAAIADRKVVFSKKPIKKNFGWALIISYSGNTRETLFVAKKMKSYGNKILAITSGGELAKSADAIVGLPPGMMPRDAMPYMLAASLMAIGCRTELNEAIKAVRQTKLSVSGEMLAQLEKNTPVIYSSGYMLAAAKRFKEQLNENAKRFAFFSELPEAFHNDIEPLFWDSDRRHVPIIVGDNLFESVAGRVLPNAIWIKPPVSGNKAREVVSTMYLLDFLSFELSEAVKANRKDLRGVKRVKKEMSSIKDLSSAMV
jgi:glucose/mannose-6-phosphate isomerase